MELGKQILRLRNEKGMSQKSLAERLGISRQAVSKWESGQSVPDMENILSLCELFEVSTDLLLKGPGRPGPADAPSSAATNPAAAKESPGSVRRASVHYEFKSKTRWFGIPLVHIHVGNGVYVAKGIIAIGNIAFGGIALGVLSVGLLSFGALALGLVSLGALAVALLLSLGGCAIAVIAIGGAAVGIFAIGGLAVGMFSLGGFAVASHIAIGGYAAGHIAIGDSVKGAVALTVPEHHLSAVRAEQVQQLIEQEYPKLWKPIVKWVLALFS